MKKNFIWASLAMVLGIFTSFNALSADGVIKFRGTILDSTCSITGGTGAGGKEFDINFGVVTTALNKPANTSLLNSKKPVTINLTSCPDYSNIKAQFTAGTVDNGSTNGHTNYFPTTLKNVAIALYDKDNSNQQIQPNGIIKVKNRATTINLDADLVSTKNPITVGAFTSEVRFTITYP
ncbi:fimbrial protein [Photorhabdus viridis]|uniref:fimbrial protein n=1 Tax=Photorhabdus viridis TaxID=3163327 RepID=UPI003307C1F7